MLGYIFVMCALHRAAILQAENVRADIHLYLVPES